MDGVDATLDALQAALAWRALRHELIAANLANAETPGYARLDVAGFRAALAAVLQPRGLSPAATRPGHLAGRMAARGPQVYAEPAAMRPDGNGVDLERELAELARNALEYAALTRLASDALARLRTAVEGR